MANVTRNTTGREPTGETLWKSRGAEEGARGREEQEVTLVTLLICVFHF
jgi:hypothetical protein